ncbi:MAG: MFS transporter, partial [Promethearchaeota archaeon]
SHDIVPSSQRSRFFGLYAIFRSIFMLLGFILSGLLVQLGYWKLFFISNGLALIIFATIVLLKVKEPKRGVQREELMHVLQDEKIKYDFTDREMRRKTMRSKTNLVALIEGIFTSVFLGSLIILVLPYIQTAPHNFSPLVTGIYLAIFGLTGGLIGQVLLARVSDRVSSGDKIVNRLYFIIAALAVGGISFTLMFFIPLPHLTVEEGSDILYLFSFPIIWIFGFIRVISRSISSLYEINQPPILQEINLPETQGRIIAWNRFLESIGFGAGPLIAGLLIIWTGYNYQLVAIIISAIAVPGIILWVLALKYFEADRQFIKKILAERAQILKSRNTK